MPSLAENCNLNGVLHLSQVQNWSLPISFRNKFSKITNYALFAEQLLHSNGVTSVLYAVIDSLAKFFMILCLSVSQLAALQFFKKNFAMRQFLVHSAHNWIGLNGRDSRHVANCRVLPLRISFYVRCHLVWFERYIINRAHS